MAGLCSIALSDEDLLRFVMDGVALPLTAMEHLEQCVTCQQRLARYNDVNTRGLSLFYRSQCPDSLTLSYYYADILSSEEKVRVAHHVGSCPLCAAELKEIQSSFSPLELADIKITCNAELPDILIHADNDNLASGALLRSHKYVQDEQRSAPKELSDRPGVHYYRFDEFILMLHFSCDYSGRVVIGGTLSSMCVHDASSTHCGVKVELYRHILIPEMYEQVMEKDSIPTYATYPFLTTVLDNHGELEFCDVPLGDYFMIVYLPETALVVEELHIEHS
jgi:hypothetical protein